MKIRRLTIPKKAGALARLRQQALRRAHSLNGRTHGWLGILSETIRKTFMPGSVITAAAIAFYSIFSLFPLILLSISIASFSLGSSIDQHSIIQKFEFIAPALSQLLGQNLDEIILAREPISILAVVGLVWSASTIFDTLTQTLNDIWGHTRRRPVWKRRGLSILFILVVVGPALFVGSFAGSGITSLRTWLPEQIIPLWTVLGFAVAILLDIALFMVIYIMLPHGASTWREILPGAIGAGLLWEIAKMIFLSFVSTYVSISNLVYGSVAAIMAFLLWAYLSGLIFHFGAFLSISYFQVKQLRNEAPSRMPLPGSS